MSIIYNHLRYSDESFEICEGFDFDAPTNITEPILHPNTKIIESYAFRDNKNIKVLNLPEGLEVIRSNAFAYSTVEEVSFPTTLKRIMSCAFSGTLLKKVDLSNTKASVGNSFIDCWNLEEFHGPDAKLDLEKSRFSFLDCNNLKLVDFSKSDFHFLPMHIFKGCRNLKTCILPETLGIIAVGVFYNTSIENINIPNSVHTIGKHAFVNTPLKKIVLPDELCCDYDFLVDSNIEEVYYRNINPEVIEQLIDITSKVRKNNGDKPINFINLDLENMINQNRSFKEINEINKQVEEINNLAV